MWRHPVLIGNLTHVSEDLWLASIGLCPVRLELKGERIHRRLHITFTARIAIEVPRSADIVAGLENDKLGETFFKETLAHHDSARARPDDYNSHWLTTPVSSPLDSAYAGRQLRVGREHEAFSTRHGANRSRSS